MAFGGFNNALNLKDKNGGLAIPFFYLFGFKNCILQCNLVECNLQGCVYTWNKRGIASNIDKVLINPEFLTTCPTLSAFAMPTMLSDHTPIIITFNHSAKKAKNYPFRYVNFWHHKPGYDICVSEGFKANT